MYHALVLGLLVHLDARYEIRANKESGLGCYDVLLRPRDVRDPGVILEFKVWREETREQALTDALAQIQDRSYAAELKATGVTTWSEIGVAFSGREVTVRGIKR